MSDSLIEYEKERKNEEYKFELNLSNILALYGRLSDLIAMANVALASGVNWFGNGGGNNIVNEIQSESFIDTFLFAFYKALGISVVYGVLGIIAA